MTKLCDLPGLVDPVGVSCSGASFARSSLLGTAYIRQARELTHGAECQHVLQQFGLAPFTVRFMGRRYRRGIR